MKTFSCLSLLALLLPLTVFSQSVYVDSNTGNDNNAGTKEAPIFSIKKAAELIRNKDNDVFTIKINPGILVLDSHVKIGTEKEMANKRIIIESSILPDDTSWRPEKMPVIINSAVKGEIPGLFDYVVSFLIDESHVTLRGIKFHGYAYPNTRYFPVARLNKTKTDLLVEQCMFIGDANISQIQVGVIANGNGVKVDHCVFYKIRNTVVYFQDSGDRIKSGNSLTNSIIYGVGHGVWTVWPDKDFVFKNNVVSNCKYVWIKNKFNSSKYSMDDCIVVNNKFLKGVPDEIRLNPGEFELTLNNLIKEGEISLRLIGLEDNQALDSVDKPLPVDYMHIIPGTTGYEKKAGIFKSRVVD